MGARALDAELDRELAFHFDQLVAEKIADGLAPDDARRAARLEFGNIVVVAEASRDQRSVRWVQDLGRDAAFGVRLLRKSPVFTTVAAVSLALGIGANAAVLTALDMALVRGLPLPHADRLVFVRSISTEHPDQTAGVSVNDFLAWKGGARSYDLIVAMLSGQQDFAGDRYGPPEHLRGLSVTPGLFAALGVTPLAGRVFDSAESRLVDPVPAIVISERLWRRRFAADPQILGATIRVGGVTRTIVGVMSQEFRFQDVLVDFWVPLHLLPEPTGSAIRPLRVIARLEPGVSVRQAQAELDAMAVQLGADPPRRQPGWRAEVQTLDEALYGWARKPLLTLQIAVGLVLLIACANVAGLLLARGSIRQREINLRIALGAARERIVRQLLTESLLLALAGGLLGIGVAWVGMRGLSGIAPAIASPALGPLSLDLRALAITFALSVLSALGFGIVPAFLTSHADPLEVVRAAGAERLAARPRSSHGLIVAVQCALALVLMIAAGLLVRSSLRLGGREFQFDPDGLLMFDLSLPVPLRPVGTYHGAAYFDVVSSPVLTYARVLERLRTLGGVESAGGSSFPVVNSLVIPTVDLRLDEAGDAFRRGRTANDIPYFLVTPDFFAAMRVPVLHGRDVSDRDTDAAPWVAIVNESAARQLWPGENPIGKRFMLDTVPEERTREVVGVVPDIPLRHGDVAGRPVIYASYLQQPSRWRAPWRTLFGSMTFVVRTTGDPLSIVPAVRRAVGEIDPDRPVAGVGTVRQHLDAAMRQFRGVVMLVSLLACTAGALAAIGIYATVAYTAGHRVREIGVRKALGADTWQIAALVAKGALLTIGAGVASGLVGALALNRLLSSQLWGIGSTDPATYATTTLVLIGIGAMACFLPVRRAMAVDPATTIRCE